MERHMEQQCWLLQSLRNVVMWLQLEDDMHHELIVASVLFGSSASRYRHHYHRHALCFMIRI